MDQEAGKTSKEVEIGKAVLEWVPVLEVFCIFVLGLFALTALGCVYVFVYGP